jgi:DNA primase
MVTVTQVDRLLDYIGVDHVRRYRGDWVNFKCPVHQESKPSAGINLADEYFHCFACATNGSLEWFLYKSLPDQFKSTSSAARFLKESFNIASTEKRAEIKELPDYTDLFNAREERHIIPLKTIAPFQSGKETYQYFFERGFTKKIVKDFMIGRDLINETVTIPIFWEDNKLAGVIGRYVNSNYMRYMVYNFPKSELLFPLNHFNKDNDSVILVEGLLDAMMMYQYGYDNVLALMTNSISNRQINILLRLCNNIIVFLDNDERGQSGQEIIIKKLKTKGFNIKVITEYPEYGKDQCDWSAEEIEQSLLNARPYFMRRKLMDYV